MSTNYLSTTRRQKDSGVGELSRQAIESFVDLIGSEIRLAKTEIALDAKTFGGRALLLVAFVPLLAIAYLFGCVALALVLSSWLPLSAGFAIVGGVNMIIGALGCATAWRRLQAMHPVQETISSVGISVNRMESAFQSAH